MKFAAATVVVALTAIACSGASERALLDQFFVASRLRDRTALARFSTVVFEPRTDGIVEEFVVAGVTRERQLDEDEASGDPTTLDAERLRVINLSLSDPTDPVDPNQSRVVLWEKNVTVSARLASAGGLIVTQPIVVTLRRARVANGGGRSGRWIVVRFVHGTACQQCDLTGPCPEVSGRLEFRELRSQRLLSDSGESHRQLGVALERFNTENGAETKLWMTDLHSWAQRHA